MEFVMEGVISRRASIHRRTQEANSHGYIVWIPPRAFERGAIFTH